MKMSFVKHALAVAAAGLLSVNVAVAEEKAQSLDQLLQMVQQSKIAESKDHKQREAEFRREKSNQKSMLDKAERTKAEEEARSARLEKNL